MKKIFTLLFVLLTIAAIASTNVTMTFGYFDCYTGHKVQPTTITAQQFSATGQVEETILVNPTNKNVSLPTGKYLLTINCNGYRQQIANVAVAEDNATVYEFFLSPFTKDYRAETEYVQSKVQSNQMLLNGFVVDENGLPIANATLTISNKQEQTTTNNEGYFEILFPLQGNEEYINFQISKNGFTKNIYNNVLCWNKGDWTYQVKLRQGNNNTTNIIESTTAAPHIETPEQLFKSLPNIGNGNQPQALTSGSCVPNSINVAFSSTGTNCCPGGGGGFPSCQTVQNYIVDVYVEHVIPNEWLASWNALPNMIEAFKAGAVAIRSYSVNRINHPVYSSWYDICSSPCCQNFGATNSITSAGVTQTTDYVLYYNSDVALSEYSAENNHLLPQCTSSSLGIFCTDGQFSLLGVCYSDPVSTGKRINGHGRGMSQRGSARWASGKSLNSCSNSTSGLPNTGLATKNWTQILNQYYPPYTVYYCGNTCPQPSNDLCGNAITLTPASTCTYTDGTTCGASPINPTTGMPTCVLSPSSTADVWYKFVATNSTATISVQSAANFDAVVQVLQNVSCASSYTQMQCVNNTGVGGLETISLTGLTVSSTYWIRIVCNTGSTGTDFQVCVTSIATPNCPDPYEPNDAIASAYNLFPSGLSSSSTSANANGYITTGADQDWFLLNISAYGTLNINLTNLPANYDLALYTGSGQLLASSINTGTTSESISYSYTSSSGVTPPLYIKVYPNNSSQYSVCSSYSLSVSWTPSSTCITPTTPTPTSGTASCPGNAVYSSTFSIGWTPTNSNYDLIIEEYPYGSSNIVYSQTCLVGNYPQIAGANIVSGKMYRYYVRATTDCNTCNSAYSQPYYFQIAPEIFPNPSIYVCNGTGVTLSTPAITVPSGATVTYQWYRGLNSNPTLLVGQTGNTCYVTQSGTYYVKAVFTGSSVCSGTLVSDQSLYTNVSIANTPSAPVLSSNSPVCEGNALTISTPYISGCTYFWSGPNGFTSNNTSITIQTVTSASAGVYSCYVINSGCQSPTANTTVTINPAPTAAFTYSISNNTVTFTNTSTNATSYNWTFGDGQTSTQTNPTNTYSSNNNYSVCLTANSSGCNSASNCQLISLGGGSNGSTVSTFAKLFQDTSSIHKYWVCYDIIQSAVDSGYIGLGWYQNNVTTDNGIKYYKLDKNGNILWVRALPEFSSSGAYKIVKSQNGYLITMNYNLSTVMEIDEQGNKLWGKQIVYNVHDTISNTNYQFGVSNFVRTGTTGYIGVGSYNYLHYFDNFGTPTSTEKRCGLFLVKLDNSGNVLFQKQYPYSLFTSTSFYIRDLVVNSSGDIYLYGNIYDGQAFPPFNSYEGIIVKVDVNGNHQWTNYYSSGTNVEDGITSLAIDNNSDILFTGYSRISNVTTGFVCKLNSSGSVLSSKQFPTGYSAKIFNTNSGNMDMLVTGYPINCFGIVTANSSFSVTNEKLFNFKNVYSIKKTYDNNFVVCGQYPLNTGIGDYRYHVFKTSYTNSSCLDTTTSSFSLSNFSFPLNTLAVSPSTIPMTISNFAINPTVSLLSDTNVCHQCNASASITPNGATSFCSGGNVTLTANAGMSSYLWSNGQTGQSITVSQTGNYSVAISDSYSCPATSQNVSVTVNPLPYADAGIDQTVCSGSNAIIGTAQISGNTYSWTPSTNLNSSQIAMPTANPNTTTNYTVTVTDVNGCVATSQTTVTVNSLPIVDAGNNVSITQGGSTTIGGNPTATGNGSLTYNWTPSTNLSSTSIANPLANPTTTTTYFVSVTDGKNCSATDSIIVTVNPIGCTYSLSDSSYSFAHSGGTHIFNVTTSNSSCTWTPVNSNSWFQVTPNTQQTGNGTITITADSCSNGTPRLGTFTVAGITYTVNQSCTVVSCNPPVANFAASQTTGNCPFNVDFFDLSQTTGTTIYQWTIYNGGGSPVTSSLQNPTGIFYNVAGSFLVKLEVTDSCGTDTKISANFITVSCQTVGIDNIEQAANIVVYPNPTNDILNVVGNGIQGDSYSVSLYNTLGQSVFESNLTPDNNKIEKQIDVSQLTSGIYFLTINSTKGRQVFKVNKQ